MNFLHMSRPTAYLMKIQQTLLLFLSSASLAKFKFLVSIFYPQFSVL